ncbi:MAG TPA: TolC family protein [Bacteroidia bacterium]|nr:TolC family protein [Bacteroidia bacterium]
MANAQVKTLDDYVNAAISNSPVLKDYNAQLGKNGVDSMLAGAQFKPQVNMTGIAMYAPTYGQFGYDPAISNGGEYSAIVSVTQQITPRKQVSLTRMLSATEREAISSQAKTEENDLRKEVTDTYLNTCLLQQQVVFYKQSDSFLVKEQSTVKALTERGSYKVSDYYELLVEEQSEHTQIAQLYIDLTKSFSELNILCGITDTAQYKLAIPHIEIFKQNDLKQLAAYKKFQADSANLAVQGGLVDAGYKPKLSWYADAGIEASEPNLIYRSFGNSLGLNLSIPIYDGRKRNLQHQSLKYSEDIRSGYEHFFISNYSTRISLLAKQIEDGDKLLVQMRLEEKDVNNWIKISEQELAVGNISVTDFLLAIKKDLEVKNDLTQALINQQLLQNEFNYWNH